MSNLKPAIIAIVGSKKSGKTTTAEAITRELTKRGYKVATVKHVSEPDFTIDTEGKDTWRFAKAGAKTIIAVAATEIATIEKTNTKRLSIKDILRRCRDADLILIEGLRSVIGKEKNVPKIIVFRNSDELSEASDRFRPMLSFSGPCPPQKLKLNAPCVDAVRDPQKMADIVENYIKKAAQPAHHKA